MRLYSRDWICLFFCCYFNKSLCFPCCPLIHAWRRFPNNSTHALTSTFHNPAAGNLLAEKLGQVLAPTLLTRCTGNKNKKNRARKDRPTHPFSKGVRGNRNSRKAAKQFTQVSWAAYSYPGEKWALLYRGKKQHEVLRESNPTGHVCGYSGSVTYTFSFLSTKMLLLSIFADLFEWRKHIAPQTHLSVFVPSKCLLLSVRTGFRSKQQEGQGLGLVHSLPSGLWMLRCPTLQAFFESLAHGGFFSSFFHVIYSGPMQIFVY